MTLYKNSTKIRPLLFFETFINNKSLMMFEDMFYNSPINPSQESFKQEGYIKYYKDSYVDEPFAPVIEYFKDKLEKLLKTEIYITNVLLTERSDELEYQNTETDIFIQRQLSRIEKIKASCDSITVCKELVIETINILEKNIRNTNSHLRQPNSRVIKIKTNKPFFDPKVRRDKLIKLYNITIENGIIDEEEVSQTAFLNVFMSNNPEALNEKIIFASDNQVATFFLNSISILFNNLSHSQISRSKSFFNKRGKLLNQNDLDKAKTLYEKKGSNKVFLAISKDIQPLMK